MDDPQSMLKNLLELSPPVVLWAVLNILMVVIRRVPHISSWSISCLTFVLGGVIYPSISDPGKVSFGVHSPIMSEILTGLLIGGAAIGGHSTFLQYTSKFGIQFPNGNGQNGDTQNLRKTVDAISDVASRPPGSPIVVKPATKEVVIVPVIDKVEKPTSEQNQTQK